VVDGGSSDGTAELAAPFCDRVLKSEKGRARQMNAGAAVARGDALLFLHADTRLPADADRAALAALERAPWGRFDVRIEGRHPLLPVVAAAMNLRSRLTGIATGDQAIFVRRDAFRGFPEIPLMEDVAFSAAMAERPACLRQKVVTSGRRWERGGVVRTVLLMWRLRFLYAIGVPPARLARDYADRR
jgi:rSAM/selenodomain-associated transferase 2